MKTAPRRRFAAALASSLLLSNLVESPAHAAETYQPTWASVDTHAPAPTWFQDAKFGIMLHWGPYSVPAYKWEWYPREMYQAGSATNKHHTDVYGDPATWGYDKFITGGSDKAGNSVKFAPKLTSAGGRFDPAAWAQLFADAGAKFAGPVAEHHDGFSMWDSQVNPWNAVDRGPRLDLVGLLSAAIRAKNMKVMLSNHNAYNFNGYYQYVPPQSSRELKMLYGQLGAAEENQLWYDKLKEMVDGYQPDYIWHDTRLKLDDEQQRLNFLAYYYNQAVGWKKDVVVSYNDGLNDQGEVKQYERGGPADIVPKFWLSEDSVSPTSWGYTEGMTYYSTRSLLHELIDRVSKNGAFMLNIAPRADGTIPQQQQDILRGIGQWLGTYGEAIYSTRPWVKFGEGPTVMGGGSFVPNTTGTASDFRFTRNKANNVLYAIGMGAPAGGQAVLRSLDSTKIDLSSVTGVSLVGGAPLTWTQDGSGMRVNLPAGLAADGYAIKISFSGVIPQLADTTYYKIANRTSGKVLNSSGSAVAGSPVTQWADSASPNLQWEIIDAGNGYSKIKNKATGLVLNNTSGSLRDDNPITQWSDGGSNNLQWQVTTRSDGYSVIKNKTSGKVLNNSGGSLLNGSAVTQWRGGTSYNLQWRLIPVS